MVWSTQFNIGEVYYGVCLLKVIIWESHLNTTATTSMIQTKLSNLDIYIHTMGNYITKFNTCVLQMIDTLELRGEITKDLVTNMFTGTVQNSFFWNISNKNRNTEMK